MNDIAVNVIQEAIEVSLVDDEIVLTVTPLSPIEVTVAGGIGPAGAGFTFTHDQAVASDHWVITHAWPGGFPSVTVVDTSGSVCYGEIHYIDTVTLEIFFTAPFSGKAYLN